MVRLMKHRWFWILCIICELLLALPISWTAYQVLQLTALPLNLETIVILGVLTSFLAFIFLAFIASCIMLFIASRSEPCIWSK